MLLTVERYFSDHDTTLGLLRVDGEFQCYTLEDQRQAVKVANETRIPSGRYKIDLRNEGGMTLKYAQRYPFHEGMLWLRGIKDFTHVYIHTGNNDDHTSGCLLVGYGSDASTMTIQRSRDAYEDLYKKVLTECKIGNLEIEIFNRELG